MTPSRIEQAQQYAESPETPRLAREFILELLQDREYWERLSKSQDEALDLADRGLL